MSLAINQFEHRIVHTLLMGFVLVLILLVISGCSSGNDNGILVNFKSGISEIQITDDSQFPSQVSNTDLFIARVVVQNRAAYELSNVKVGLVGLDADKITLENTEQELDNLEGRSLTYPEGDRREVVFSGQVATLKLASDDGRKDAYQVYVNYDSVVEVSEDMCLSGASMILADGGCIPTDTPRGLSGQGAPLAITNIYSQAIGTNGQIRFTLENRGRGDAVYANLNDATLGGKPIVCQFLAPYPARFEFQSKKSVDVSCSFELQEGSKSYLSPFYVNMRYGYRLWQEELVTIRKVGVGVAPIDERFLN